MLFRSQVMLMGVASFFVPMPQILLISAVGGVTSLIPYAGPLIGGTFGVFYYFAGESTPMESIWALLLVIAVAHVLDNAVIAPAILSHNVDLHPLTVALVLIVGGETMGILGLLIAIPVASSVKVIAQDIRAQRFAGVEKVKDGQQTSKRILQVGKWIWMVFLVMVVVILIASRLLFDVGIEGSLFVLGLGTALFITVNLAIGFTISTLTQNQLQAMQASVFILLPSILLSGFMFPFRGMPLWAQYIGETLPATHFMRIVRGLMLKGASVGEVSGELVAIVVILFVVSALAISR